MESRVLTSTFAFSNCSWGENSATFGAAVDLSMHKHKRFPDGSPSNVIFTDCTFKSNTITYNETSIAQSSKQYLVGNGVFVSTAYTIQFDGKIVFSSNSGTALFTVTSTIVFAPHSVVLFENNSGHIGAAISLAGLSAINVQQNSTFTFRHNHASSRGAAIYHNSINQHEFFAGSTNCFIKRLDSTADSITFKFDSNNVEEYNGHDIWATTLNHCQRMCKTNSTNPTEIFRCVGNFSFSNRLLSTMTSGARYTMKKIKLPLAVIPGQEFQMPFDLRDDLGNVTTSVYNVKVSNINKFSVMIDPAYTYIADGQLKVYGMPGHKARLTLIKTGVRPVAVAFNISLKYCPPGYVIQKITHSNHQQSQCVCAVNTDKSFDGIAWCNITHYYAYAKQGMWFGYEGDHLHTAHCPFHYCSRRGHNSTHNPQIYSLITEALQERLDRVVCNSKRTGILCGKCISNHSVSYHNYDLICKPDDMCRYGWLLYITTELLPLTLLFLTVIFFNISFTTGTASAFIFFAQVIDSLVINGHGRIWLKHSIYKLTEAYRFIYRFFNLDFFSNERLAFCLIKGATALDTLSFKYVTILYAFTMIFAMIFILQCLFLPQVLMYYEIHTQELSHPRSFCISHNVLYAMHTCVLLTTGTH